MDFKNNSSSKYLSTMTLLPIDIHKHIISNPYPWNIGTRPIMVSSIVANLLTELKSKNKC